MWGDQDAALKDHLLCRDVPVVAAQAARDEPLQDVVWSSEQRPAQVLLSLLGCVLGVNFTNDRF
jgi:hypothetical protein